MENDTAVILFTSGSEAVPKGVPLTHGNILSNIDGSLEAIQGYPSDVMYGFLPPFHSFGMTIIVALSMVGGVKVAFDADPKKYRHLAHGVEKWKATLLAGTPDFLSGILNAGEAIAERFALEKLHHEGEVTLVLEEIEQAADFGMTDLGGDLGFAEHAAAGGVTPACVSSRRRFTGWWEYMIDDAIFTAPPRGEHSGAALLSDDGKLMGIASLWVSDTMATGVAFPGNMFVQIGRAHV